MVRSCAECKKDFKKNTSLSGHRVRARRTKARSLAACWQRCKEKPDCRFVNWVNISSCPLIYVTLWPLMWPLIDQWGVFSLNRQHGPAEMFAGEGAPQPIKEETVYSLEKPGKCKTWERGCFRKWLLIANIDFTNAYKMHSFLQLYCYSRHIDKVQDLPVRPSLLLINCCVFSSLCQLVKI